MLGLVTALYQDPDMQAALSNPQLTREQLERMFLSVCGDRLDPGARNLVSVLVRNGRLEVLAEIHALFEQMKAAAENVVDARIDTAFPLADDQVGLLVGRLEARTQRRVRPTVALTPELIGGVKVQIGDEVWDASVRGQLDAMSAALTR
jgi:F-type H+-transporting ATPase subunit delta